MSISPDCRQHILEQLIDEMPFPIQRIQSDRASEFFAERVQQRLIDWPTIDPRSPVVQERLIEWQHFWTWERAHARSVAKPRIDRICELLARNPCSETVQAAYNPPRNVSA